MAHSLGGTAALNMALDHPQAAARLAGMAVVSTPLDMVATAAVSGLAQPCLCRYMLRALKDIAGGVRTDPNRYRRPRPAASPRSMTR